MSAYKVFEQIQFPNADLLVGALREMGYQVQVGKALTIYDWHDRPQTVQIVVDKSQFKDCAYDMGFVWNGQAFMPVIESIVAHRIVTEEWRQKLQATYAKLAMLTFLARKGAQIGAVSHLEDGSITFSATVEVQR